MGLPLPKGLKIARDLEGEKDLHEKAKAYLAKGDSAREGIHASDLLNPRKSCWRFIKGDGGVEDRLVNMFIVGQLAHAIIEVVYAGTGDYLTHGMDSGTQHYKDLRYSPDILEYKGGPVEIKTTRSFYPPDKAYLPDDETFHAYLEQLLVYMAAEGKTIGRLTLLYLNMKIEGRTEPQFYIWTVETSEGALAAYRVVMERGMAALVDAKERKDPSSLPLCRAFMCRDCTYWDDCKPEGRYEFGQTAGKKWTA